MAANDKASKTETAKEEQDSPILIQMGIFAAILFVSSLLSPMFPASFPVPMPVMGLVILYVLLCLKVVKLRNVAKFGDFMISLIAFLFVPSGIQMAANLDIMKAQGLQIVIVTIIATIVMLLCIAYTTAGMMWLSRHIFHRNTEVEE